MSGRGPDTAITLANDVISYCNSRELAVFAFSRGQLWKIYKTQNKNIIKCNTLAYLVVNDWNAMSKDTVLAPTLNIFKSRLEDEWKDKLWKYDPESYY